jgi:CRISPR-associated endonuclease/helicase Cas3
MADMNAVKQPLLGKWRDPQTFRKVRGFYLNGHMVEVMWGLRLLFEQPFGSWPSMAHALHEKMAMRIDFEKLKTLCVLSAAFHDTGKACSEFQKMLWQLEDHYRRTGQNWTGPRYRQSVRHEFVSGLALFHDHRLRTYVEALVGHEGLFLVLGGAAGHHLKASARKGIRESHKWPAITLRLEDWARGVRPLLESFGLPPLPDLSSASPVQGILSTVDGASKAWTKIRMAAAKLPSQGREQREGSAIKWITILADVFGSVDADGGALAARKLVSQALARIGAPWENTEGFTRQIIRKIGDSELNEAQKHVAGVQGNTIYTASTGGGKTVAALAWASNHPSRLIFAAHTTDAATVLFRDYGIYGDALRHSRAFADKARLLPTPEDDRTEQAEADEEAASAWSLFGADRSQITFCTADQILGLPAFYRKSVMWLPYILCSQVVFDEVHSYDHRMRGWHQRFAEYFPGVRSMNLSATLSQRAVERLQAVTGATHDPTVHQRSEAANAPRYRIKFLDLCPEWQDEGAQLWIVNTVYECQNIGLADKDAIVYHSHFKHRDRTRARDELVRRFRAKIPTKVVATQVAEMSLDVDADVLFSEVAPPAAMIQRLGRLNRYGSGVKTAYFYLPVKGAPYVSGQAWEGDYAHWVTWLKELEGRDISQNDLEQAFQTFEAQEEVREDAAQTLLVVETERKPIRENGVTVQVVEEEDANPDVPVEDAEFPVVLPRDRVRELRESGRVHKYRLIVDLDDGWYDGRLGWMESKPLALVRGQE